MNIKTLRIFSIFFLLFLGFGGIYGAWMLISDPSGGKFGFQLDLLDRTPFSSYLIPGIILQGTLLLGWLTLQLIFNPDFFVPLMHYTFYAIGMMLIILGIWGSRHSKNLSS